MPTNRNIGIAAVMAAADEYFEKTGRRVTFEYVLLAGVNDRPEHARELVALLERPSVAGESDSIQSRGGALFSDAFAQGDQAVCRIAHPGGAEVHVRRRKGERIDAACGQLRRQQGRAE